MESRRKKWVFYFLSLFLGTLFLEIVGQGISYSLPFLFEALREKKQVPISKSDPELGWVFYGQRSEIAPDGKSFLLKFNSLGLRGREIEYTPIGLMFLGDSVTMGQELPLDKTFPSLLGGLNAGFAGYSTMQEVARYRRDLYRFEPKKVGLVVCANDFISKAMDAEVTKGTLEQQTPLTLSWYEHFSAFKLKGQLLTLFDPWVKDFYYLRQVERMPRDSIWRDWTETVLALKQSVQGELFIVFAPPRSQVRTYRKGTKSFAVNAMMKEFFENQNIRYLDLLPHLAEFESESLYLDPVHFSTKGHEIVARVIGNFLNSNRRPEMG